MTTERAAVALWALALMVSAWTLTLEPAPRVASAVSNLTDLLPAWCELWVTCRLEV